jgi:hypothetical protein
MTGTGEYRDGVALWSAATSRAKTTAKETGVSSHALLRRFVFDRFLARVFHDPSSPWVLKGGTAVLARVHDARTTKDVDLFHQLTVSMPPSKPSASPPPRSTSPTTSGS